MLSLLSKVRVIRKLQKQSSMWLSSENKEITKEKVGTQKKKEIQFMQNGQLVSRQHLVIKKEEDIKSYVMQVLKNYFRTTNKNGLTLESNLIDHGLDSLDQIEIAMVIEEELGYIISAETLPVLQKVKHIVNYIQHVEQFKTQLQRAPLP